LQRNESLVKQPTEDVSEPELKVQPDTPVVIPAEEDNEVEGAPVVVEVPDLVE